jgi:1-acyl-sn-glycerol-3-phosphate acyltransferase
MGGGFVSFIKTVTVFFLVGLTVIFCVPFGFPAFLLGFLGLRRPMAFFIAKIAQFWALVLIGLSGCRISVRGRENIPEKGPVCFVSNHVGIFDIVLALGYIGRPFGFIAKKELLLVPVINVWIYILGGLFIDRKQPRQALKTINRGIDHLKAGGAMLIFPEGTRSKGRGLGEFRPGALKLASHSAAPVVPVAIIGSYEVFEKDRRIRAVPVKLSFSPVIDISELSPMERKQQLPGITRKAIEKALAELV